MTPAQALATTGIQSSTALWYLTRSTGIVALVLLTASVVVGVIASVGWTSERWPRFLSQDVHRTLSLFCAGFVVLHVVTTVSDGYVPIGFADAFIPFQTAYRPMWVGFGALAFDLLLAVLLTSAFRHRIGFRSWRFVHWLAYLCWPVALVHGLGSGSDSARSVVLIIEVLCAAAVFAAVAWRIVTGRTFSAAQRTGAALVTVVVGIALAVFAMVGPLRSGWSRRAGTSVALLAQLARKSSNGASAPSSSPVDVPTAPFTAGLSGTQMVTDAGGGDVRVTLALQVQGSSAPLRITLVGPALSGGGVALSSGQVTFGPYTGSVTGLTGATVDATVSMPHPVRLVISLNIESSGALSGTVTASVAGGEGQ